jgi:hypothetical protein
MMSATATGAGRPCLDPDHARALAESFHRGQRDSGGAPLIAHVRRVAAAVPEDARVVAWLHEVLDHTSIREEELLARGLTSDELRALRLLTANAHPQSDASYLAHLERLARAEGPGADIAQRVKWADLADRALNPSMGTEGWSPSYEAGLEILQRGVLRQSRRLSSLGSSSRARTTPGAGPATPAGTTAQLQGPAAQWGRG